MTGVETSIQELYGVVHGDRMEVRDQGVLLCSGSVDEVDPAHGVVWIIEDGIGERRMIHAQQYHLQHCLPDRPSLRSAVAPAADADLSAPIAPARARDMDSPSGGNVTER